MIYPSAMRTSDMACAVNCVTIAVSHRLLSSSVPLSLVVPLLHLTPARVAHPPASPSTAVRSRRCWTFLPSTHAARPAAPSASPGRAPAAACHALAAVLLAAPANPPPACPPPKSDQSLICLDLQRVVSSLCCPHVVMVILPPFPDEGSLFTVVKAALAARHRNHLSTSCIGSPPS